MGWQGGWKQEKRWGVLDICNSEGFVLQKGCCHLLSLLQLHHGDSSLDCDLWCTGHGPLRGPVPWGDADHEDHWLHMSHVNCHL